MRYTIDSAGNGYILTIKESANGAYVAKLVFVSLQEVFEEVDKREAEQGKNA